MDQKSDEKSATPDPLDDAHEMAETADASTTAEQERASKCDESTRISNFDAAGERPTEETSVARTPGHASSPSPPDADHSEPIRKHRGLSTVAFQAPEGDNLDDAPHEKRRPSFQRRRMRRKRTASFDKTGENAVSDGSWLSQTRRRSTYIKISGGDGETPAECNGEEGTGQNVESSPSSPAQSGKSRSIAPGQLWLETGVLSPAITKVAAAIQALRREEEGLQHRLDTVSASLDMELGILLRGIGYTDQNIGKQRRTWEAAEADQPRTARRRSWDDEDLKGLVKGSCDDWDRARHGR